ncbi:MAG: 50S ribosomal protein L4 [Deltaproteobacteria bacterium CG11_big_fil_rev_8_21_14_0_20_49_13]|nr:MAG: 50S ribosomal protein L4 [Deltaproteobacteria bacterium CG11_big_fil_rev_8_21_14_0_20_49_13]
MTVTAVYDINKEKVGEIELPDAVFNVEVNKAILHQAVTIALNNKRQGTVKTKTRSEIRGGGKKPYKQKGTGRARHGSIRSPIFVGGGVTFGPLPRDWHIEMPKKQKKVALRMALSLKNKEGALFVVSDFVSKDGKTSKMAKTLSKWEMKSGVFVADNADDKTQRSVRNIPYMKVIRDKDLSILDLFKYENLILTKDSIGNIANRLSV